MTQPELVKAQAVQHLVTALATASFEVMSQHVGDVPILVAGIGRFIEEIDRTFAHGFKQTLIAYLSEAPSAPSTDDGAESGGVCPQPAPPLFKVFTEIAPGLTGTYLTAEETNADTITVMPVRSDAERINMARSTKAADSSSELKA